jgi:hypothetical protein
VSHEEAQQKLNEIAEAVNEPSRLQPHPS